ncbi:hypothetical protein M413DRAFT_369576 [Hebeloma cylindrosporum]|uniref:Uncharacterized protein n=1 Tax=Hebeloma cylindrosporum TaxID=76867 RepID=A0A0C2XAP1_HEBCY|nr:hypothetical protein M413DRAFT_369576 [Hebeloma cylindrosporum h7]
MTKSGVTKDERDTPMRRVRHRDGKLLRGGIGLTTGLGWSDSEDEDAPSPLTRRLSTLNLARRSSASSILTTGTSSSRRLHQQHPLSRSYSSGALESEHREFDTSYDDDELDDDYEDNTLQESGEWARIRRPSGGKKGLSASAGASRPAMPPPTSWQSRSTNGKRASGGSAGARTSTSSAGSVFSLEVTIPEGSGEGKRASSSSSTSRMVRPGGRSSLGSSAGGTRDSSGSSTFDHPNPSKYRRVTPTKRPSGDEVGTPTSTASTLSIPMPATPRDYDGLSSSTTPVKGSVVGLGMKFNKEKSLPPLPSGGLKRPSSRTNLVSKSTSNSKSTGSTSNAKSTGSTPNAKSTSTSAVRTPSDGAKYAFPRARTFSSTSSASASSHTFAGAGAGAIDTAGSPPTPVRPLQLPRQTRPAAGDRAAVPVPSIPALSASASSAMRAGALRTPSLTSARFAAGYDSVPSSPLPPGMNATMNANSTPTAGAVARPKPRTGTGMVYKTSSSSMGSKMRAPLVLASGSAVGGGSVGAGGGGAGVSSIGRAAGRPIVL